MESAVAFIRNFTISAYGLNVWDVVMISGAVIGGFMLVRWVISVMLPAKAKPVNSVLTSSFTLLLYGVWAFIVANAVFNNDYGKALVVSLPMLLPAIRKGVAACYKRYDAWIDSLANRR